MTYKIKIDDNAKEFLASLPKKYKRQISQKIDSLKTNPIPQNSVKLNSSPNLYRIRSGDYRIIYQIKNEQILICVLRIGHRKNVYERLPD